MANGPLPWRGSVMELADEGSGLLERSLDHTADEWVLGQWGETDETQQVDVRRRRRNDVVVEKKPATVYRYLGERRVPRALSRKVPVQMTLAA